jgi:heme exporter protein D
MIWHSASEFFAMGGYGLYVWGSFGVCALAMVIEPWLVSQRRNQAMRSLRREVSAQQLNKESM